MQTSHTAKRSTSCLVPTRRAAPSDFAVVEVAVPDPARARSSSTIASSRSTPTCVDACATPSRTCRPLRLGEVMTGMAVGEVVASQSADLVVGDIVVHDLGWREYALGAAAAFRRVPAGEAPAQRLARRPRHGRPDRLGRHARDRGAEARRRRSSSRVPPAPSAVSPARSPSCAARPASSAAPAPRPRWRYLRDELGFDAAFDYHEGPVAGASGRSRAGGHRRVLRQRRRRAPRGGHRRPASARPGGPMRGDLAVQRRRVAGAARATSRCWSASGSRCAAFSWATTSTAGRRFSSEVGGWLADGRIRLAETIVDGVENAPGAFIGLMRGENLGKMLVRVGGD